MSDHARFAPSAAERWLKCGYCIKMQPFYPNTDNAASLKGTERHGAAAMHLENGTEPLDPSLKIYTNEVRKSSVDGELLIEHKVIIVPELCEGTLDAAVVASDWVHNFDLKYGKGAVHATENPQQMLYGLGLVREFQLKKDTPMRLTIVQPNGNSGWPVKNWDTDVEHLLKFYEKVKRAIDEGLKENPKAVAGSHCFWCPAKIHCHAYLVHSGQKK